MFIDLNPWAYCFLSCLCFVLLQQLIFENSTVPEGGRGYDVSLIMVTVWIFLCVRGFFNVPFYDDYYKQEFEENVHYYQLV